MKLNVFIVWIAQTLARAHAHAWLKGNVTQGKGSTKVWSSVGWALVCSSDSLQRNRMQHFLQFIDFHFCSYSASLLAKCFEHDPSDYFFISIEDMICCNVLYQPICVRNSTLALFFLCTSLWSNATPMSKRITKNNKKNTLNNQMMHRIECPSACSVPFVPITLACVSLCLWQKQEMKARESREKKIHPTKKNDCPFFVCASFCFGNNNRCLKTTVEQSRPKNENKNEMCYGRWGRVENQFFNIGKIYCKFGDAKAAKRKKKMKRN